jgi:hypothetical protein
MAVTIRGGKLGCGKTAGATWDVWREINKGINCFVNWHIDFSPLYKLERTGWRGRMWRVWLKMTLQKEKMGKVYYFEDLEGLYDLRQGHAFYDEAHQDISAREYVKLPKQFIKKLTLSRHYRLNLDFITQHTGQLDCYPKRIANYFQKFFKFWFIYCWKEWDGDAIEILANPALPRPKSIAWGFHIYPKILWKCYDSFVLPDEKEQFKLEPMWSVDKFKQIYG